MKMSCNGCRVLRKGCNENCAIRPCLQWISSPDAQANATFFLAKFYGRAGLINLITAGPEHLRPAIFRSLLYEACGRVLNPVYGSVGLLWSNRWQMCQAAVESVLRGAPITQIPTATVAAAAVPPLKTCDIRHVAKNHELGKQDELHQLAGKSRTRFKRTGMAHNKPGIEIVFAEPGLDQADHCEPSHDSMSHSEHENDSHVSVETAEGSHLSQAEPVVKAVDGNYVGLELTLSLLPPVHKTELPVSEPEDDEVLFIGSTKSNNSSCRVELGLGISA